MLIFVNFFFDYSLGITSVATLPPASGPGAAQGITSVAAAGTISVASTIGVSFVVSAFSALPQATHIATIAITIKNLFIFVFVFFN
jgi:hypothetical protein